MRLSLQLVGCARQIQLLSKARSECRLVKYPRPRTKVWKNRKIARSSNLERERRPEPCGLKTRLKIPRRQIWSTTISQKTS